MLWLLNRGKTVAIKSKPIFMGILNVTPDSFSDGGRYLTCSKAYSHAIKMLGQGADIIDIGGESTRPGAMPVSVEEEQARILPIASILGQHSELIISVDTYNSSTAKKALACGAHIINDVFGLQYDTEMAHVIGSYNAGVIIMHTNRAREPRDNILDDMKYFFDKSLNIAYNAGIRDCQIALDPGFGFGKDYEWNVSYFKYAEEIRNFYSQFPFVAATSRKRFLGTIINSKNLERRDVATAASSLLLRQRGFDIFRVHNVLVNRDVLTVFDSLKERCSAARV